jgi:hypothetical protein
LSPELWTKAYSSAVIKQAYKAMEVFYAVLAEDLYVSIVVTFFAKTFSFLHQPLVYYSVNIGISKRHMHSLEIYQSWLSSYRIIINKINIFIRENIPEFTILLQDMELYLFKDFLFCRIADNLPINLRRQIFQSLYVYFSENIIDSFYNELVYKYNMYDRYLNFHCSFKTKVKKLIKVIILYIKSFINDFGKLYDHEDNQHRKNTI